MAKGKKTVSSSSSPVVKASTITSFGDTEYELTRTYMLVRLVAVFVVIPLISRFWRPFKYVYPTDSHIDYSLQ